MTRILKIQLPNNSRFLSFHDTTVVAEIFTTADDGSHPAMCITSYKDGLTESGADATPPVDGKTIRIDPAGKFQHL